MSESFEPTAYPLMVETDGKVNTRAFELFDMMRDAGKALGLSDGDAYALACLGYNEAAKPFREKGWV